MTGSPLEQCALIVCADDNVAVAKRALEAQTVLLLSDGASLRVNHDVPAGHRFAICAIPSGHHVLQYGEPIGTSRGLQTGDRVTPENMSNDIPLSRHVPDDLANPPPDYLPESERRSFRGYRRADGRVGTRNWVLIVPTSMCSAHEAVQTAQRAESELWTAERYPNVDGVVATPHNKGCGCPDGSDVDLMLRTLTHSARHPNVGAVVFIDLGCEKTNHHLFEQYLGTHHLTDFGKPVAWVSIQGSGGSRAAVQQALRHVADMLSIANQSRRERASVSELVLGLKCGGSDGLSGLSANPALGFATDLLIRSGGAAILTEITEVCGAEHVVARRAGNAETARNIYRVVDWYRDRASRFGIEVGENRSPGNVAGGLLNITLKSLGAIAKAGTTRIEGVLDYAEPISGHGLHLMQGPGYDQESVPGIVAAGATVVVFTTGLGTPMGNAIAPVVKLASNSPLFERMRDDMDMSAGGIIDGADTIAEVGERLFELVCRTADGQVRTRAEVNRHREFQIWSTQPITL